MWLIAGSVCLLQEELFSKPEGGGDVLPTPTKICPEVEFIKLKTAKIYRFLQLLSHSRGFFARV